MNCLVKAWTAHAPELRGWARHAITRCDLQGLAQADYARAKGLSLNAAMSRIQRARLRMKARMTEVCQVQVDNAGHVLDFVPRTPVGTPHD